MLVRVIRDHKKKIIGPYSYAPTTFKIGSQIEVKRALKWTLVSSNITSLYFGKAGWGIIITNRRQRRQTDDSEDRQTSSEDRPQQKTDNSRRQTTAEDRLQQKTDHSRRQTDTAEDRQTKADRRTERIILIYMVET